MKKFKSGDKVVAMIPKGSILNSDNNEGRVFTIQYYLEGYDCDAGQWYKLEDQNLPDSFLILEAVYNSPPL